MGKAAEWKASRAGEGTWTIAQEGPGGASCLLGTLGDGLCLVVPAAACLGQGLLDAVTSVAPAGALRDLVILGDAPDGPCPPPEWLLAGFSGRVLSGGAPVPGAPSRAAASGACLEPSELGPLRLELDALRTSNYELREAMVGASDAALRDPASGLYGRVYAEAFLSELLGRGGRFSAAFVRVDRVRELNRRVGAAAVDGIFRDLAALLLERSGEAFLFRWVGPAFLLVFEGEDKGLSGLLESLLEAARKDARFAVPISLSVALVRAGEPRAGDLAGVLALGRERLKLLERKGGDAVLDRSDIEMEEKSLVLVLDPDPLFLDFLVGSLEREGFHCLGAAMGGEALELMDRARPELVIADAALSQFDAFQIRTRMRASADLRGIPFILLSSGKTDELVVRAHSLSIFHVFGKPVSVVELAGLARHLLSRDDDEA